MNNNQHTPFTSAAQMAGWLHYGGAVISYTHSEMPEMVLRGPNAAYMENKNYRYSDWQPDGELPENWCPIEPLLIDTAKKGQRCCSEIEQIQYAYAMTMLLRAKQLLLQSIDPRLQKGVGHEQ